MSAASRPISRWPVPELAQLPEDIRSRIQEVQDKAGFVPNVFLTLAHRPDEFRAFFAYHDALMLREESGLSKGDREMIVTTTSAANNCLYCVVAHGAILRIYEKKPLVADQVAVNYRKADITPRQRAMLDFAMKVCLESGKINAADGYKLSREEPEAARKKVAQLIEHAPRVPVLVRTMPGSRKLPSLPPGSLAMIESTFHVWPLSALRFITMS